MSKRHPVYIGTKYPISSCDICCNRHSKRDCNVLKYKNPNSPIPFGTAAAALVLQSVKGTFSALGIGLNIGNGEEE